MTFEIVASLVDNWQNAEIDCGRSEEKQVTREYAICPTCTATMSSHVSPRPRTNTVDFPLTHTPAASKSSMSLFSARHATALEVCDVLYGPAHDPAALDAIQRFYEAGAIPPRPARAARPADRRRYENPFVAAPSRALIADLHALARALATVDVPTPRAALGALFPFLRGDGRWFRALRVWSEIGDVCESESFDGHRRAVVSHTLHILLLPGLHAAPAHAASPTPSGTALSVAHSPAASFLSLPSSPPSPHAHTPPQTLLGLPSPLHRTLPLHTHLAFNDAGRITAHRDVLDVRDALSLLPGGAAAGWVLARIAGRAAGLLGHAIGVRARGREGERWGEERKEEEGEEGPTVDVAVV
ncbi:hypothetical protein HWV62_32405 [Athelia sp. TMB]|nr:hypothetical protein HWV62_32405 [Athelia sp. TMB]